MRVNINTMHADRQQEVTECKIILLISASIIHNLTYICSLFGGNLQAGEFSIIQSRFKSFSQLNVFDSENDSPSVMKVT